MFHDNYSHFLLDKYLVVIDDGGARNGGQRGLMTERSGDGDPVQMLSCSS